MFGKSQRGLAKSIQFGKSISIGLMVPQVGFHHFGLKHLDTTSQSVSLAPSVSSVRLIQSTLTP